MKRVDVAACVLAVSTAGVVLGCGSSESGAHTDEGSSSSTSTSTSIGGAGTGASSTGAASTGGAGGGSSVGGMGGWDGPAELPRVYVDTEMPDTTGYATTTVAAGGDLQAALDAAACGTILKLSAGATFTGNFVLPAKACDEGHWIVVTTDSANLPAAGHRVAPADAPSMARLLTPNSQPVLTNPTTSGALPQGPSNHYRLVGLEIAAVWPSDGINTEVYDLVQLGYASGDAASYPHHVVFDRVYVHGTETNNVRRAFYADLSDFGLIDSYVAEIHEIANGDTQTIGVIDGTGPFKIVNNYLEAAGENLLFGGADPTISGTVTSDVEFRRNYVHKPLQWDPQSSSFSGTAWANKNLFEIKNGARILMEGNVFENSWAGQGHAIVFTPRNAGGACAWCTCADVTFRYNRLSHASGMFNMLGADEASAGGSLGPAQPTQKLSIHDNVFEDIGNAWGTSPPYKDWQFVMGSGNPNAHDVSFVHNTVTTNDCGSMFAFAVGVDTGQQIVNFAWRDSILAACTYGLNGDGGFVGAAALDHYAAGYVFTGNVLVGWNATGIPAIPMNPSVDDYSMIGFVNWNSGAGGDYHLAPTSTFHGMASDGKDTGADIDAVAAATAGVSP